MDQQLEVLDQVLAVEQQPALLDRVRAQPAVDRLDEGHVLRPDDAAELGDLLDRLLARPGRPEAVDERRVRSASSGWKTSTRTCAGPGNVFSVQFGQT